MKRFLAMRLVALVFSFTFIVCSGFFTYASAQSNVKVTGQVTDNAGLPVIGAGVVEDGTTSGVVTDASGNYAISVKTGAKLVFTCLGYETKTVVVGEQSIINVVLNDDTTMLDEVVMIGYGTAKKSTLTGALSQVSSQSFKAQKVTRVDQALQGRASGVQVSNTVGAPGGDVRIRVRGANSVLGDNSPLFVIDGFVGADSIPSILMTSSRWKSSRMHLQLRFMVHAVPTALSSSLPRAVISRARHMLPMTVVSQHPRL